jgi:hypothetical protein
MLRLLARAAVLCCVALGLVFCSNGSSRDGGVASSSAITGASYCPEIVMPVCAELPSVQSLPPYDQYGTTYSNGCWAGKAGATVVASGKCPGASAPCGATGGSPLCAEGYACGHPAGSTADECLAATKATHSNPNGTCAPVTCAYWGTTCGPAPDGCGGIIECGTCGDGYACRGWPSACVPACTPLTCADYPSGTCGEQGDGCGGVIQCLSCTAPETCGGDPTKPGQCGYVCPARETCAQQGVYCGETGDGCGNILQCGTCTAPQTCGGGGVPSQCGAPKQCQPLSCAQQGDTCGPQSDGCGGLIASCGTCPAGQACRGTPSQCVVEYQCVPKTCASYPAGTCGPQADGCGGETPSCGSCTAPETCGGNGGGGATVQTCGACGIYGYPPCGTWNPPVGCGSGLTDVGGVCTCAAGTTRQGNECCGALGGQACPSALPGRGDGCSQGVNSKGTCVACGQEGQPPCADGLCKAICPDKSCQGTFNPNFNPATGKNVCTASCGYAPTPSYDMPCNQAMISQGYCMTPSGGGPSVLVTGEAACWTQTVTNGEITETQYSCYNHAYLPLSKDGSLTSNICMATPLNVSTCPVASLTLGGSGTWSEVYSAPPTFGATCPNTAANGGVTVDP